MKFLFWLLENTVKIGVFVVLFALAWRNQQSIAIYLPWSSNVYTAPVAMVFVLALLLGLVLGLALAWLYAQRKHKHKLAR